MINANEDTVLLLLGRQNPLQISYMVNGMNSIMMCADRENDEWIHLMMRVNFFNDEHL